MLLKFGGNTKQEGVKYIYELGRHPNVFTFVRIINKESADVIGVGCMIGDGGIL